MAKAKNAVAGAGGGRQNQSSSKHDSPVASKTKVASSSSLRPHTPMKKPSALGSKKKSGKPSGKKTHAMDIDDVDDENGNDLNNDGDDAEEQQQNDYGVVDFGPDDAEEGGGGGGRRAKKERELKKKLKAGSFETMNLPSEVLRAIKRKGYRLPTPIQRRALPPALAGHDVVAMARTGSGKTAAFAIPIVCSLRRHSPRAGARAVVLSPARELALQTHSAIRDLAKYTDLRVAALVGGDALEHQFAELASNPDVLVATPGRLLHLLAEVPGMTLSATKVVVFDEADRLFEMGFAPQLAQLLSSLPRERQALLFSATMPSALAEFAAAGLRDPEVVRLDAEARLAPGLRLGFYSVRGADKPAALRWLLREAMSVAGGSGGGDQRDGESNDDDEKKGSSRKPSSSLAFNVPPTAVFASTRHHVELLSSLLEADGLSVAAVHGSMDQAARTIAVGRFRARRASVLVVTDVAARGLDLPHLDAVVNYDFPPSPKLFVHRAGRVARAGREGWAHSLVARDEAPYLLDLHLFLGRPLRVAPGVSSPGARSLGREEPEQGEDSSVGGSTVLGSFPQDAVDAEGERVRSTIEASPHLQQLARSAENASRLYLRTRPPAAAESAARAKKMVPAVLPVHPSLARVAAGFGLGGGGSGSIVSGGISGGAASPRNRTATSSVAVPSSSQAAEAARMASALRAWRPSATVLEADVAPSAAAATAAAFGLSAADALLAAASKDPAASNSTALKSTVARTGAMSLLRAKHGATVLAARKAAADEAAAAARAARAATAAGFGRDDDDEDDDGELRSSGSKKKKKGSSSNSAALEAARRAAASAALLGDGVAAVGDDGGGGGAGDSGNTPSSRFRDPDFYLPSEQSDRHLEAGLSVRGVAGGYYGSSTAAGGGNARGALGAAVLDLAGDDGAAGGAAVAGLAGREGKRWHWDSRKKRYVALQADETIKAGKRVRGDGAVVVGGRGGGKKNDKGSGGKSHYERWSKATKLSVAATGEAEGAEASRLASSDLAGRFKRGGRGWENPASASSKRFGDEWKKSGGGRGPRDEVKNAEQMRADWRREEKKREREAARRNAAAERKRGGGKGAKGKFGRESNASSSSSFGGGGFSKKTRGAKGAPKDFGRGGARAFGKSLSAGGGGVRGGGVRKGGGGKKRR